MAEQDCACQAGADRAARDAAYRHALWIVVVLELGFGLFEMLGGFLAGSQALKADSLGLIGDGSISLMGLLALALANVAVIVAAVVVAAVHSAWPDILVAAAIAALFLHSAVGTVTDAGRELRELS